MQKKISQSYTYPLHVDWRKLKSWGARIALVLGLSASLTSVFNGFVGFLADRVSQSINSDIQSIKSVVWTITDSDLPFLRQGLDALSDGTDKQNIANDKKFDVINAKLDKVATKEDLQIILNVIKK